MHVARNEGFNEWLYTFVIDYLDKSAAHRDTILTYLSQKLGIGLKQPLEKQVEVEYIY